jgi:hypothetical protein
MTEHPLTDEKALNLFSFERLIDTSEPISIEDAMRAAADWQLEQVVKALNQCKEEKRSCIEVIYLFHQKLEAMRPTTTQENS